MANNRTFLRCKGCGKIIMLGKTFGHEWYFTKSNEEKGEELAEFLKNHSHCCDDLDAKTCGGVSPYDDARFEPFELIYESQEDFGKKKSFQQIDNEL